MLNSNYRFIFSSLWYKQYDSSSYELLIKGSSINLRQVKIVKFKTVIADQKLGIRPQVTVGQKQRLPMQAWVMEIHERERHQLTKGEKTERALNFNCPDPRKKLHE